MLRSLRPAFLLALLFTLGLPPGAALARQELDRSATEQRLRELQEQIAQDQQRLSQTAQAERASLENLAALDRQIALRRELIKNYQRRIAQMSFEGDSLRTSLTVLEEDLRRLKTQYRERAVHAYKYGRIHDLSLILGAESINQMLVRVRYLHRFAEQRRDRLGAIQSTTLTLMARRRELEIKLERNEQLLREAEVERRNLTRLQQDRRQVIAELQARRGTIESEIGRKREAAGALERRIRDLIAAESSRRAERTAVNPRVATEYIELSGSFLQNRGGMPWPSEGVVQEPFGETVHPVYGTTTPNPGILIATPASAEVRAVFDGEVADVSIMPEYGTFVVVSHGEYRSLYSNFSLLYVSEGERIRAGQVIGRAGTDAEPKGPGIFFALFQHGEALNPVPWLRPR